ncbi:hypothetical protein [Sinorhizobium meliloti]|uniref:hypothetical protein n=1 Tax=Rhizobium meliloti TaxID=382 RepID=UPI003F16323C
MILQKLTKLDDWAEDVVLIDVAANGNAIVREPGKQLIPNDWVSVDTAIQRAQQMKSNLPWITGIAVHLQDGAVWEEAHGHLVD